MEDSEIKFSLEDIRDMLEKWKGATICTATINNIVEDFHEVFIKKL